MTYITQDEAVQAIIEKTQDLNDLMSAEQNSWLSLYANRFVSDVCDYCHRDDFPKTLVYTAVELIGKWVSGESPGKQDAPIKTLTQDDTTFTFAVTDVSTVGSQVDADVESIRPKLNLYRKLRWSE